MPIQTQTLHHSLQPLRHQLMPRLGQESVALRIHLLLAADNEVIVQQTRNVIKADVPAKPQALRAATNDDQHQH